MTTPRASTGSARSASASPGSARGGARLLGLLVLLAGLALLLPPLFEGLPLSGQRALAVPPLPTGVGPTRARAGGARSLRGAPLLAWPGAAGGFRRALRGFATPVPSFLVGVLALGVAVWKGGLAGRLARHILVRAD